MVVVPDASVILKWVLQKEEEPNFLAAFQILEAYQAERVEGIYVTADAYVEKMHRKSHVRLLSKWSAVFSR